MGFFGLVIFHSICGFGFDEHHGVLIELLTSIESELEDGYKFMFRADRFEEGTTQTCVPTHKPVQTIQGVFRAIAPLLWEFACVEQLLVVSPDFVHDRSRSVFWH